MGKVINGVVTSTVLLIAWNGIQEVQIELKTHVAEELSRVAEQTPSLKDVHFVRLASSYLPEGAEPHTGYVRTILPFTQAVTSGNPVATANVVSGFGGNGLWKLYERGE